MRAVVQRVLSASVEVDGAVVGRIGSGLLVYAAAAPDDADADLSYIAEKVAGLRVFTDSGGKMNLAVGDAAGAVLVVSAFTAHADARKGRRPSFDSSASAEIARPLIGQLATMLRGRGLTVETGRFGEYMQVASINDGPICILLDSRRLF